MLELQTDEKQMKRSSNAQTRVSTWRHACAGRIQRTQKATHVHRLEPLCAYIEEQIHARKNKPAPA